MLCRANQLPIQIILFDNRVDSFDYSRCTCVFNLTALFLVEIYKVNNFNCLHYFSIAHTVHESVTEQSNILVNGKLKEYQIKV